MADDSDKVPAFGRDIRKEFILRENSVFLNHGAYGSIPRYVHERQVKYLVELESHPDIWFRYNMLQYLRESRDKVADFMGIAPEDIQLLQNVTKAINTVVKTCPLKNGDSILISTLTYVGVDVTVHSTAARLEGVTVRRVDIKFPITSDDSLVKLYEEFLQKHTDVKLAIVDYIASPASVILPVKRITEVCHRHGIIVAIDAAHIPGQMKADIQEIDADFYTGNLHKWVFCPRSCAFIWMNPRRQHTWFKPLVTSAFDNDSLWEAFSNEGTKDDTPYICASDGIDYFNRIGGLERIAGYNSNLLKQGVAYLEEKWGVKRLDIPDYMETPYLRVIPLPFMPGFTDSIEPPGVKTNLRLRKHILDTFDIQVAIVIIEAKLMVRVAVQVYNTMDDFKKLANGVLDLTKA